MFEKTDTKLRNAGIEELKQIIDSAGMPSEVLKIADMELEALLNTEKDTAEYSNRLTYIGYLIDVPWNSTAVDDTNLQSIREDLYKNLKGDDRLKERIFQHLTLKLQKPRVMIVDDEKIALRSIERALSKEGYLVVSANSGAEAIEKLKETEFDIVITDLIMGEIDGHAVIKETKDKYPDTKVIMVTGYATVDTAVEAIRMGAFHYLEKPLKLDDVRSVVKDALKTKLNSGNEKVICLTGVSDEEKYEICNAIADATGRNLTKLSLSEIKDRSEIIGKSRTVDDAAPGRAIVELRRAGAGGLVVMIEGLDLDMQDSEGDLTLALLEIIDPAKNRKFTDRYLETPFDMANVILVGTANNVDNIKGAVKELIEIVEC